MLHYRVAIMNYNFAITLFVNLLIYQNGAEIVTSSTVVQTRVGSIQGLWDTSGNYSMYLGVPYGRVNETNPFGAASRYPAFEGVYEAYDDFKICPQNGVNDTLDCLRMNIFVPHTAQTGSNYPVLVYIHGGAFEHGSGSTEMFNGKFFMKHDVILVTVNYRLGPFGFFCLDIPEVPGNQGLKDQLLALRWVNENIEAFGGDPTQVTISGESAGGMSVETHLFSSQEKLFKGIIPMSGSTFYPGIGSTHDIHAPMKLAAALGFNTHDVYEALSFLATIEPNVVISAMTNFDRLYPCVEKQFENVEIFLADYPVNINPHEFSGMSILLGITSHECIASTACGAGEPEDFYPNIISDSLEIAFNFDQETLLEAEQLMKHFYIGDEEANATQFEGIAEFQSDFIFNYPAIRSTIRFLENGARDVYYYMFSYDGGRNVMKIMANVDYPGAVHSDALGYLFPYDIVDTPDPTLDEDQLMIDRMTTMWVNFVKYGNPTPETTELLPVKWEPITSLDSPLYYMNIDSNMEVRKRPYHARLAFLDLFYKHNRQFLNGLTNDNAPSSAKNVYFQSYFYISAVCCLLLNQ